MKGKKTDLGESHCPIARTLSIIGDWWSLLIIRNALGGTRRFGEFQRELGLARNILSSRLRKLVDAGILETAPASDGTSFSEYRLTEKGEQLYLVLAALWQWGERYASAHRPLPTTDHGSLPDFAPLELRNREGRLIGPRELAPQMREGNPAT